MLKRIVGLILIIAIGLTLYAFLVEPRWVEIARITIETEKIPKEARIKIIQISDLHLHEIGDKEKYVLKAIEELNPDLVVITGDLIDDSKNADKLYSFLRNISQVVKKVYIVLGNWDYWSTVDLNDYVQNLENLGAIVLINSNDLVMKDKFCINIVGVDDPYTGRADLEKALMGIKPTCYTILLAHSPQIIDEAVEKNVDLILTGHTHGGQVVIPFYGPLFLPLEKKYRKYSSGLFKVGNSTLYVNRGLGTSIIPVRLFCRPEITLIEIIGKR